MKFSKMVFRFQRVYTVFENKNDFSDGLFVKKPLEQRFYIQEIRRCK